MFKKDKTLFLYILILPLYLVAFFLLEKTVTKGAFVSYIFVDDLIPFIDFFVIPYVLWYPLLIGVGTVLLLKDSVGFKKYMSFMGIGFFSIVILNFLFTTEQNLRVDLSLYDSVFSRIVALIYKADTNTNVCPSMHVVGTLGALFAVFSSGVFKKRTRTLVSFLSILITLSTVFIKQHSLLDVFLAIPYAFLVWVAVYKLIFKKRGNTMKKIAIAGYGNLGKGVEAAIHNRDDMELVAVITRRSPDSVKIKTESARAIHMDDVLTLKGKVDAIIICAGSATDLPKMTPELAKNFNVIDSFDTHAKIPEHFKNVDAAAVQGGNIAMISVGWDPGMFSVNRLMSNAILPNGKDYTFWGRGVSQGHSDAIRRIEGVIDARQYTVPVESAVERAKSGEMPDFTTREKHTRECYVVAEEGADLERIEKEIKSMPNYFADYDTTVTFITKEELEKNHKSLPHGGKVIRTGKTGFDLENSETIEYSLTLSSNPEFTASTIVAYTSALLKMKERGEVGCKTVFDVSPADLSTLTKEEMLSHML